MRSKRTPKVERKCETCGVTFVVWQSRLRIGKGRFCSTSCGKKGSLNRSWNGGVRRCSGYIRRLVPEHPYADSKGSVLEHRLVMEKNLGRYLTPDEVVHHKNHIRDDNRIENLELLDSQSEHYTRHMTGNKIWVGKKHKPETIEKMKKLWSNKRKKEQGLKFVGAGNPNYRHGKYIGVNL